MNIKFLDHYLQWGFSYSISKIQFFKLYYSALNQVVVVVVGGGGGTGNGGGGGRGVEKYYGPL